MEYWTKLAAGIELFEALVAEKWVDHGERREPRLFGKPAGVESEDG